MDDLEAVRELNDKASLRTPDRDVKPMLAALRTKRPTTTDLLTCIECRRPWLDPAERWRLKVTDDSPPEAVPYCARCADREFGPAIPQRRRAH